MHDVIGRNLSPGAILAVARFAELEVDSDRYQPATKVRAYPGPDGAGILEATNRITLASIVGFESVEGFDKVLEFRAADLVTMVAEAIAADPGETFEIRAVAPDVVELRTPRGAGGRVAVTGPTVPLAAEVVARFSKTYEHAGTMILAEPVYRITLPGEHLGKILGEARRAIAAAEGEVLPEDAVLLLYRLPDGGGCTAAFAVRDGGHFIPKTPVEPVELLGWANAVPLAFNLREIAAVLSYAADVAAASVAIDARIDKPAVVRVFDTGPESGTGTFLVMPFRAKTTRVAVVKGSEVPAAALPAGPR